MNTVLADMAYQDHNYDVRKFNVETDMGFLAQVNGVLDATDTNLAGASGKGAKFLFYQGWSDPALNPLNTVEYYRRLVDRYGQKKADTFVRMFFVPGMTHCGGGVSATDTFDTNAVMEKWLDTGVPPEQIEASKVANGTVTRTKPLCAFPKYARFRLSASASEAAKNDAANYSCAEPAVRWPR
jgi:feruloyl esterase